jgi:hypothetical protein
MRNLILKYLKQLLLCTALLPSLAFGQKYITMSGKITDSKTGEDIIGASVIAVDLAKGVTTNSYGFYSISLPEGKYSIRFSYLGYENVERVIEFKKDQIINIEINPSLVELNEVIISSGKNEYKLSSPESGMEKLDLKEIEHVPVLFGERDLLKTLQLLPGISSSAEGSTGFNVRGGSMGQNLILLDEAPLYSSSHLMGFFSIFNSDAIKDVALYKGSIPAAYGGRASSVIDITMKNGNNKKFSCSGGVGLVSTRLTIEGPLIKDKMSFIVSGRRTYADIVAKLLFPRKLVNNDMEFYFYDLNAKLNYTINTKNRIFLSGYFGKDVFEIGDNLGTGWGNTTGTLRWNHLFSERVFSKSSLIYSNYNYGFIYGQNSLRLRSGIKDVSFKEDLTFYLNPDFTLRSGVNITYHRFSPGELKDDTKTNYEILLDEKKAIETAIYLQSENKLNDRLNADIGLRLSSFTQMGPGWFYNYDSANQPIDSSWHGSWKTAYPRVGLEPRVALNYRINSNSSLKLSYTRNIQYLHLLSNTTTGSPTDIWMPSSNNLSPLYVDQISSGFFKSFLNKKLESSIEIYFKNMINTVDYEDGAEIVLNKYVESQILTGKGRSYGIEFYFKKNFGSVTGWVSYTISRTENKISGINDFKWYPVKYDKTHDINLVVNYKICRRLSISGVWTFTTGNAVTFPSGKYLMDNNIVPYYTERNGYRMPYYHRMDICLTLEGKTHKKYQSSWDFSVFNLYNRYNAYVINFRESTTNPGTMEAVKLSLFGIVPSITYNFRF